MLLSSKIIIQRELAMEGTYHALIASFQFSNFQSVLHGFLIKKKDFMEKGIMFIIVYLFNFFNAISYY